MRPDPPKFTVFDAVRWKLLPTRYGGGAAYLLAYKDAWIVTNRQPIREAARQANLPPFLLGGVAWIEVGGKDFTDRATFTLRSLIWSPLTRLGVPAGFLESTPLKHPARTSMGAVSIQLRRAAETLGMDPAALTPAQWQVLATALQSDRANLKIVAGHLQQLQQLDFPKSLSLAYTDDQVRILGTRYFYGPERHLDFIKGEAARKGSYGNVILKYRKRVEALLQC